MSDFKFHRIATPYRMRPLQRGYFGQGLAAGIIVRTAITARMDAAAMSVIVKRLSLSHAQGP